MLAKSKADSFLEGAGSSASARHFGIVGATFSGNRGAEAMLLTCAERLQKQYPGAVVHVLSYAPKADLAELQIRPMPLVFVHSCTPATLVLKWFFGSLIALLLPFLKRRPKAQHSLGILSLLKLDAVFCLAGVSFIDGREKFLPFNVLTLFPFLLHGVRVIKMAQALGPIRGPFNILCAQWVLPRLSFLFARGQMTAKSLEESQMLDRARWQVSPDIAFGLSHTSLNQSLGDVALVPSVILDRKHPSYRAFIIELAKILNAQGLKLNFVVHSWKSGTDKPFNNDLPLANALASELAEAGVPSTILGEGKNAREIKTLISAHKLCLTSRFHGMIAGLDSFVPTLVVGWSHKYREILAMLDREAWALKYESLTPQLAAHLMGELLQRHETERRHLEQRVPALRQAVDEAFNKSWEILK